MEKIEWTIPMLYRAVFEEAAMEVLRGASVATPEDRFMLAGKVYAIAVYRSGFRDYSLPDNEGRRRVAMYEALTGLSVGQIERMITNNWGTILPAWAQTGEHAARKAIMERYDEHYSARQAVDSTADTV